MMAMKPHEILVGMAETFRQRHEIYGDNYKRVGAMTEALFPNGIVLQTSEDHDRFHILSLILVKLSRYAMNWGEGGHADSIHDAGVYCAMLEYIDANQSRVVPLKTEKS